MVPQVNSKFGKYLQLTIMLTVLASISIMKTQSSSPSVDRSSLDHTQENLDKHRFEKPLLRTHRTDSLIPDEKMKLSGKDVDESVIAAATIG